MIVIQREQITSFTECVRNEFLLTLKGIEGIGLFLLWLSTLILQSVAIISCTTHIGNAITTSGWVTQILISCGISFGVMLSSRDYRNWCEETIDAIPYGFKYKIFARVTLLVIFAIILFVTGSITLSTIFLFINAPKVYYIPTVAYILLYWIIPFVISGLFGMFWGQIIRTKFIYFIIILFSLLLGPLIPFVANSFGLSGRGKYFEYYMLFSIGQLDPQSAIYESYGYTLNSELWLMRLLQMIAMTLLLLSSTIRHSNKGKKIRKSIFVCVTLLWAISICRTNTISHVQLERYRFKELNEFYNTNCMPDSALLGDAYSTNNYSDKELPYSIEEYHICLNDGDEFCIETTISMSINENCHQIVFSLFHGFRVKKCEIDCQNTSFRQECDALIVDNFINKKGTHKLLIKYSGIPPANLYKDENKWILPAGFAWIPIEYIGKTMEDEKDIKKYFSYPMNKCAIPITLEYIGSNELFCSLKLQSNNIWSGISTGTTVFCGWFDEYSNNSITIIYPAICPENPVHAEIFYDRLIESYPIITEELLEKRKTISADKIFMTTSLLYLHARGRLFIYEDHILACLSEDFSGRLIEVMDGIDTVKAIAQNSNWDNINPDYINLFLYGYIESLHERGRYRYDDYIPLRSMMIAAEENEEFEIVEICAKLHELIISENEENQILFFRNFLKLLNVNNISAKDISNLIENYIEGVE